MSFAFSSVKQITIPEGVVKQITRASDNTVLWKKIVELTYYGKSNLGAGTQSNNYTNGSTALAATTVGNYALFGGGGSYIKGSFPESISELSNVITSFNTSLTKGTSAELSAVRYLLAATTVGNYALFGGGVVYDFNDDECIPLNIVDAYNTSLTRSNPTVLSIERYLLAATTVGNYALFGGGAGYDFQEEERILLNTVDAYNTSLTHSIPTALSSARSGLAATTVGNYALFGGGGSTVDAYNTSLTRSIPTALSVSRRYLAATAVGDYALFGGGTTASGRTGKDPFDTVDVYNKSLVKSIASPLSLARGALSAVTLKNYALFGGGCGKLSGSGSKVVDAYDEHLTRTIPTQLFGSLCSRAATTVGNYALFGGGDAAAIPNKAANTVDIYTLS